ncbi:hypothetical protein OS31_04290 [Dickeya oryzae]
MPMRVSNQNTKRKPHVLSVKEAESIKKTAQLDVIGLTFENFFVTPRIKTM